ncbi:hypothetical protein B0H14DRAFT_3445308 [Mycena olivaceomarginata]|nr:hypothetical protein B0H14DRAFT_3445308 [Mycena olivaceomarginata]
MVQRLLDDNTEIKQRLAVLETGGISPSTPAPANCGIAAQRGDRITQAKTRGQRRRVTVVGGGSSENNIAIDPALDASSVSDFATDTDYPSDNDNPSDTATNYHSDASTNHPSDACDSASPIAFNSLDLSDVELRLLQSFVTKVFRRVCDISGSHWPDPLTVRTNELTDEVFPSPFFEFGITYTRNASLCIQVVKQAMKDLKDRDTWPSGLKREPTEPEPWDLPLLNELAKESFCNLKKSWRTQTNPNAAAKAKIGRQSEHQNKRCKAKAKNIHKIVDTFGVVRRLQPDFLRDISHEQYLSEEVSGPDENSGESHEAWKARCAITANVPMDATSLKKTKFLEVLSPAWCTQEGLPVPPCRIFDASLWHTRPLRWSIHRLASVCMYIHSQNPIVRQSPVALSLSFPRSRNPTIALNDDALDATRRGRNGACLGYSLIHAILPDPLLRLLPRILTGDETFPRDPSVHPSMFYQLKGRPPPRTSVARTVASLTVLLSYALQRHPPRSATCRHIALCAAAIHSNPKPAPCTPQLDAQCRTLPTDIPTRLNVCLITDGTPSRSPPRVLSAIPPMRDAAASKIVCSRRSRLTRTHAMRDIPLIALTAPPRGEYSDEDGTTRTDARASVLRDDPNATEERHLRRGRYGRCEWEPPGLHEDWCD